VRAGVGAGDSCAPFDELGTAVVVRDLAFDQYRAALVLACFADRVGYCVFPRRACLVAQLVEFLSRENRCSEKDCVLPLLVHQGVSRDWNCGQRGTKSEEERPS